MEFLIISGLSGAGKSATASILEDIGFYCVDNMPVVFIPKFAELCLASKGVYERVALVTDVRGGRTFDGLFKALEELKELGCEYKIVFVDAATTTIINRYKETRRNHPLAGPGITIEDAIARERTMLTPVFEQAEYVIDTTGMTAAKLRGEIVRLFSGQAREKIMKVNIISFGYKFGVPLEADLLFDVRFLPNPYYINELRGLTGLDEEVNSFLFGYQQTHDFMKYLKEMMTFLLPQYLDEGKTALTVGIGCTGGRHRSVAVAKALAEFVAQKGYCAEGNHRDINR